MVCWSAFLSGLARLDVDPWQEATKLAQLPGDTATERSTSLIRALSDRDSAYSDPPTTAARLIALLPRRERSNNGSRVAPRGISGMIKSGPWWIYVVFMSFVLGAQFVVASKQFPTKAERVQTELSGSVSPQGPLEKSGQ